MAATSAHLTRSGEGMEGGFPLLTGTWVALLQYTMPVEVNGGFPDLVANGRG